MSKKDEAAKAEKEKVVKSMVKEHTGEAREPKPGSKKDVIFQAGRADGGGSIKELAEKTSTTESNIRQHITQCHTVLGYGVTVTGDNFTVDGETNITWESQAAEKQAKLDAKKAEAKDSEEDNFSNEEEDNFSNEEEEEPL